MGHCPRTAKKLAASMGLLLLMGSLNFQHCIWVLNETRVKGRPRTPHDGFSTSPRYEGRPEGVQPWYIKNTGIYGWGIF